MELCTNCNIKEALDPSYSKEPFFIPGWCHSCVFWKEISDDVASGRDVKKITDDYKVYHYEEFVPNPTTGQTLGHAGRVYRIVQVDKVLITNNLWFNGVVPEFWRKDPNLQPNCKLEQDVTLAEIEQHIGHYRCSGCGKFIKDGETCRSKHSNPGTTRPSVDLDDDYPF